MRVATENAQYEISFQYFLQHDNHFGTRRGVTAVVEVTNEQADGYSEANRRRGTALASPMDHYRRASGRKLALRRALIGLPVAERTAIWNGLFHLGLRKQ